MSRLFLFALLLLFLPALASAQLATVAIFAAATTNPNAATPVASPVAYTPTCDNAVLGTEPATLTNPAIGFWEDPSRPGRECRVSVQAQVNALPTGVSYRGAVRIGTQPYGEISTAFARAAAQQPAHTCDGVAPTLGTVTAGTRTLTWCYPDGATGGSPITAWAVYIDSVRSVPSVTVGPTANTAGRRAYTASVLFNTGTRLIRVAPINAVGEGVQSPAFTLTAQAPATAPTGTADVRSVN